MDPITLKALSSSGGTYEVTFSFANGRLRVSCTCKAGLTGSLCKHRISLIAGDLSMLAAQDQANDVKTVVTWADESGVSQACKKVVEAELEKERADKQLKKAKKALLEQIT